MSPIFKKQVPGKDTCIFRGCAYKKGKGTCSLVANTRLGNRRESPLILNSMIICNGATQDIKIGFLVISWRACLKSWCWLTLPLVATSCIQCVSSFVLHKTSFYLSTRCYACCPWMFLACQLCTLCLMISQILKLSFAISVHHDNLSEKVEDLDRYVFCIIQK